MPSLTAKRENLKKTFGIVSLAAADAPDKITSHALLRVQEDSVTVYSTDGDRMAFSTFTPIKCNGSFEFTLDPKKMQSVMSSTDIKTIRFDYNQETKTVEVYASDQAGAVLAFPSFNPEDFLSFESDLQKTVPMGKDIDAEMLQMGMQFIQGFLPEEKTPKSEKYTRLYATKGTLYGANGSNKIGAFHSPELESLDDFIVRRTMLSSLTQMIDRSGTPKVSIKTTSKMVFVSSSDGSCGFGFLRTNDAIPQYPITVNTPECNGFTIHRLNFLKKLSRLAITSNKDLGIRTVVDGSMVAMATVTERVSKDGMECRPLKEDNSRMDFIFDFKLMKSILSLYQAPDLDVYIDKFKCTIISNAELEVLETKERKPFKAVALVSLARTI